MLHAEIFDTIETYRQKGEAFCVATVIRTADATSAKAGAKAVITGAGAIIGHLGGSCVQRAVRTAAIDALADNDPRMISVRPSDKIIGTEGLNGVQTFKSGCPSGGTVDLLIEPYRPPNKLVIFGNTPISNALAQHASLAGFEVFLSTGSVGSASHFDPENLEGVGVAPHDFVVIASQGNGDKDALLSAVQSPARRISMIASARKADFLCQSLISAGHDAGQVGRLKSPAGLDIKGLDPHEIAVSVLAELILWRNTDASGGFQLQAEQA